MKLSQLITFSAICNLGLLAAVGYVAHKRGPGANVEEETETITNNTTKVVHKRQQANATVVNLAPAKFTWRLVEAEDYKRYIANLRAIECPEETIRDIITADVDKLYARKLKTLHRSTVKPSNYWEQQDYDASGNRAFWKQQRALEKEKRALLVELLGVDPYKERDKLNGNVDWQDQMYSYLTPDKREKLQTIVEKYQDMEQALYQKYKNYWGEERQAEIKAINAQRKAELASFLTPTEISEYELRTSQTSNQLQFDLRSFDPNEDEFRKIFKVRSEFDEVLGGYQWDPDDKEGQAKYQKARDAMNAEIKQELGDARYKDYSRGQDYNYQQLAQITSRAGLPDGTAAKVYDIKDAAEQAVSKIRADNTLSSDQRKEALQAIQTETQKAVSDTLGETAFKKYQSRAAWWLRNLNPGRN